MGSSQERLAYKDSVVNFLGIIPRAERIFDDDSIKQVTSGFGSNSFGEDAKKIIDSGAFCEAKEDDGAECSKKGQAVFLISLSPNLSIDVVTCGSHIRRTFVALLTMSHGKRIETTDMIQGRDDTQIFATFFGIDKEIFINGYLVQFTSNAK